VTAANANKGEACEGSGVWMEGGRMNVPGRSE
jgi:hypothetical protein